MSPSALFSTGPNAMPGKRVDKWTLVAAVLTAFYFVTSLYIARHRLFWYDEILTVDVARLPDWMMVLRAAGHGVDGMSPVYDTLVRVSDKLLGPREIAARLPSALAMAAGLLITFDCVRRLTDDLYGLIALSVLTCSLLPYYGYEARSYAIYFMFSALSLWLWTSTKADNKLAAVLFGVVLFLAVCFHYYAVLLLVPYALWEISRWRPWQPLSPRLLAGVLGVTVAIALLSAVIFAFVSLTSRAYWGAPTLGKFTMVFAELFPNGLFLLALMVVCIVLAGTKDESIVLQPMPAGEAVGWLFLCIPLAGFLLSQYTHHFRVRYFIGALPGIALAFSCWLWRTFRNRYRVSVGLLLLLAVWGGAKQARVAQHPEWVDPDGQQTVAIRYLSVEGPVLSDGKQFLLFHVGMLHLEAQYYSKRPEGCILLLPSSGKLLPPVREELVLAQFHPMQFWKLDDLKQHARETALIDPQPETVEAMRQAGFQVTVRFSSPVRVLYFQ
jgi:Dolichyl-phosphate-mannose-protein mannosyltransferase